MPRPPPAARPSLRPLALPTEHGGWGFLLEPLLLGMLVAPSWGGLLICLAALFAFLSRQPLKLAMQDAVRKRSYPRTLWCRTFAASYLAASAIALGGALAVSEWVDRDSVRRRGAAGDHDPRLGRATGAATSSRRSSARPR